jgi:hypothetical protein
LLVFLNKNALGCCDTKKCYSTWWIWPITLSMVIAMPVSTA